MVKIEKIIVFYLPSKEVRNTPYIGEKTPARHDDFISHFPNNVIFYLATHRSQYLWNERFRPEYKRSKNSWEKVDNELIQADLILWMTGKLDTQKKYINPIRDFCIDKREIEKVFPEITLGSITCNSYEDIVQNFISTSSKLKVLKPSDGSQAIGIIISDTLPSKEEILWKYPYLLQKFFDTSNWFQEYPGIHDFRTIIINGKITGSFLRIPPEWVLTANVKTWATIIDYEGKTIPPKVQKVIHEIDAYCAKIYPERYYSIDTGIWKDGEVKVFELNGSPGLSTPSIRKHLAQHIIKNILKLH